MELDCDFCQSTSTAAATAATAVLVHTRRKFQGLEVKFEGLQWIGYDWQHIYTPAGRQAGEGKCLVGLENWLYMR